MPPTTTMPKRKAAEHEATAGKKRAAKADATERWAYVTCRTARLDEFPDGKVDAAAKLLLAVGFVPDPERDEEMSQDGREMGERTFYVAKSGATARSGWEARARRVVHSVFEAQHSKLASISLATRDGPRIRAVTWQCLRRPDLRLCDSVNASDVTGARMVQLAGKMRPVIEEEHSYDVTSERERFEGSYVRAHLIPERFVNSILN